MYTKSENSESNTNGVSLCEKNSCPSMNIEIPFQLVEKTTCRRQCNVGGEEYVWQKNYVDVLAVDQTSAAKVLAKNRVNIIARQEELHICTASLNV